MFIHIPMRVYDANVLSNAHVSGLPAMTALGGFTHMLERAIKNAVTDPDELESVSAMQVIHKVDYVNYTNRDVRYEKIETTKARNGMSATITDRRMAHIFQSVILKIEGSEDVFDEIHDWVSEGSLQALVLRSRFAGGSLTLQKDSVTAHHTELDALAEIPFGYDSFAIEDVSYRINENSVDGEDKLDTLLRLISRVRFGVELEDEDENKEYMGYLVPIAKGFVPVEDQAVDRGARNGHLHLYAEPVIGIARLRSLRSLIFHVNNETEDKVACFWRYPQKPAHEGGLIVNSYNII